MCLSMRSTQDLETVEMVLGVETNGLAELTSSIVSLGSLPCHLSTPAVTFILINQQPIQSSSSFSSSYTSSPLPSTRNKPLHPNKILKTLNQNLPRHKPHRSPHFLTPTQIPRPRPILAQNPRRQLHKQDPEQHTRAPAPSSMTYFHDRSVQFLQREGRVGF